MTTPRPPAERACRGADSDQFFPDTESPNHPAVKAVKARYCHICPGRVECLQWALDTQSDWGIFGGTTGTERKPMRTSRRQPFSPTGTKRSASK